MQANGTHRGEAGHCLEQSLGWWKEEVCHRLADGGGGAQVPANTSLGKGPGDNDTHKMMLSQCSDSHRGCTLEPSGKLLKDVWSAILEILIQLSWGGALARTL